MFKVGAKIVHARHGAGTVTEIRTIEREGEAREYLCVELMNGRGLVMLPTDKLNPDDIRTAMTDFDTIRDVLNDTPEELQTDHRARQNKIKAQIKSRDPQQLAQALRDLAWREHTDKLTYTDAQLKDNAQRLLAQELALSPDIALETARNQLIDLVQDAINTHAEATA